MAEENIQLPGQHPVAPDYSKNLAQAAVNANPMAALEKVLLEKDMADVRVAQLTKELEATRNERNEAMQIAADLEPYIDIIRDSRTFLPVYLRDPIVWKQLVGKLRKKYGKLVDIDQDSKTGRQSAHRRIDGAVEVIIQYALLNWHHILGRLEIYDERNSSRI